MSNRDLALVSLLITRNLVIKGEMGFKADSVEQGM